MLVELNNLPVSARESAIEVSEGAYDGNKLAS